MSLIRSGGGRAGLLRELEATLEAGVPSINLCALEGVGEELFSYAGAGTLLTRERYVVVRRLGIDDYDAADDLVARGVAEGYLAPRSAGEIERVLANGFGAFVEGRHLAGIGALIVHPAARAGEQVTGGTAGFIAPEIAEGALYDARSELFGLGVVIWELVTGQLVPMEGTQFL